MPELPEVETIVRGLKSRLANRLFTSVDVCGKPMFDLSKQSFRSSLEGRRISSIDRYGKSIFLSLDSQRGEKSALRIHLGMSGRLLWTRKSLSREKHTHVIFDVGDEQEHLRYVDARRFGWMEVLPSIPESKVPDAWLASDEINFLALRASRGFIKNILLGQKVIAGLGNIYVDESLFLSRIHPRQRIEMLADETLHHLCKSIRSVLGQSIFDGGTTFRDYVDIQGGRGGFKKKLLVYGRDGQLCECGETVKKIVVASRGTHFCPRCQRKSAARRDLSRII